MAPALYYAIYINIIIIIMPDISAEFKVAGILFLSGGSVCKPSIAPFRRQFDTVSQELGATLPPSRGANIYICFVVIENITKRIAYQEMCWRRDWNPMKALLCKVDVKVII